MTFGCEIFGGREEFGGGVRARDGFGKSPLVDESGMVGVYGCEWLVMDRGWSEAAYRAGVGLICGYELYNVHVYLYLFFSDPINIS